MKRTNITYEFLCLLLLVIFSFLVFEKINNICAYSAQTNDTVSPSPQELPLFLNVWLTIKDCSENSKNNCVFVNYKTQNTNEDTRMNITVYRDNGSLFYSSKNITNIEATGQKEFTSFFAGSYYAELSIFDIKYNNNPNVKTVFVSTSNNNITLSKNHNDIPFNDINIGANRKNAIIWLYQYGVASKASKYNPKSSVNRGAMAEFMRSIVKKPSNRFTLPTPSDISNCSKGRQSAIKWLASEGITKLDKNKFNPNNTVTRGSMAEFLWNLAGKPTVTNAMINAGKKILSGNDVNEKTIPGVNRRNAIYWMAYNNITVGSTCGTKKCYKPFDVVNRGAMAEFMKKFYTLLQKKTRPTLTITNTGSSCGYIYPTGTFTVNPSSSQTIILDISNENTCVLKTFSLNSSNVFPKILENNTYTTPKLTGTNKINVSYGLPSTEFPTITQELVSDPTLFLNTSIERNQIKKIIFSDTINDCSTGYYDVTQIGSGPVKSVRAKIVSGELTLCENSGVYANTVSDFFFANINNSDGISVKNWNNWHSDYIYSVRNFFSKANIKNNVFPLPDTFDQGTIIDFTGMFSQAGLPTHFSLPENFGKNGKQFPHFFYEDNIPADFTLPTNFAQNATDFSFMFADTNLNSNIDFSKTTFTKLAALRTDNMFYNTNFKNTNTDKNFNGYTIKVASSQIQTYFISGTGLPNDPSGSSDTTYRKKIIII